MGPCWLTPRHVADLDALASAMAGFRGVIGVADLGEWSSGALERLRAFLSTRDLDGTVIVGGAVGTVDGLVDRVVATLGQRLGVRALRVHAPQRWEEDERRRVEAVEEARVLQRWRRGEAALTRPGEVAFYVDGEAEPMTSGLLYARFGVWLDEDEW